MTSTPHSESQAAPPSTPPAAPGLKIAIAVAIAGTLGAALMAVAHMGIDLPLVPTQGLGRAVPVAAAMFGVGTVLFAISAWGLATRTRWSLALALVVNAFTLLSAAQPYRGVGSAIGIVISATGIFFLLLPSTSRALR